MISARVHFSNKSHICSLFVVQLTHPACINIAKQATEASFVAECTHLFRQKQQKNLARFTYRHNPTYWLLGSFVDVSLDFKVLWVCWV